MMKQEDQEKCEPSPVSPSDVKKNEASLRLVTSEQFTPEMAVNYLFQWRSNSKLLLPLLERIYEFFSKGFFNILPTIIFIMSLEKNAELQRFCEKVAKESLVGYLLLRWSYSAYLEESKESAKNRLDNCIFSKNDQPEQSIEVLAQQMKLKEQKLNYSIALNDYYERLFAIPEKLNRYSKEDRNAKLRQRLEKVHSKFFKAEISLYFKGILLPIDRKSNVVVRVIADHCFTFSTKERVPFKIVFETISQEDMLRLQGEEWADSSGEKEPEERRVGKSKESSLILPQSYFGVEWRVEKERIAADSPYRHLPSFQIQSFIIKSGDDLRQEYMALELIRMVQDICKKENIKIWLKTYAVIPFDSSSGLIEFIDDTRTVSFLKEKSREKTLRQIYKQIFGTNWENSISNFVESLAGYSLVQYLFQIKDRHNNNILIDNCGHIIHIDFSFMLSSSPGNINFEKAPFKLTRDYIELMEGEGSDIFQHFRTLFFFGLKYIRKYKKEIMDMVVIMTHCRDMKCFEKFKREDFERRFHEAETDEELQNSVDLIISNAINSYTTGHYDVYQWLTNYIYN